MLRRLALGLVLSASMVPAVRAQQITEEPQPEEEQKTEDTKPWALDLTLDVPTAYFFHGYNVEDSGYLFQPAAVFRYSVYSSDTLTITPYVGAWVNYQEKKSPRSPRHFNELDLNANVEFAFGQWTLDAGYVHYTYPGDIAGVTEEFSLSLAYDDSEWAESRGLPSGLSPFVTWYKEIRDENGDQDQYLEVGIEPSFTLGDTEFELAVPVTVGFSIDGFYLDDDGSNEAWGYASVGVVVSHPLPVPENYGEWTISAGVEYLYLNADSVRESNDGESDAFVGKIGLGASF